MRMTLSWVQKKRLDKDLAKVMGCKDKEKKEKKEKDDKWATLSQVGDGTKADEIREKLMKFKTEISKDLATLDGGEFALKKAGETEACAGSREKSWCLSPTLGALGRLSLPVWGSFSFQRVACQGTQSGRQVWETRVGDTCGRQVGDRWKNMRPRAPRVGDKFFETSGRKVSTHAAQSTQIGRQVSETSGRQVGDKCKLGPEHPEWETSVGDKCKLMRPRAPRVGDKYRKQVGDKGETSVNSDGPDTQSGT
eukprot:s1005_g14.t1